MPSEIDVHVLVAAFVAAHRDVKAHDQSIQLQTDGYIDIAEALAADTTALQTAAWTARHAALSAEQHSAAREVAVRVAARIDALLASADKLRALQYEQAASIRHRDTALKALDEWIQEA